MWIVCILFVEVLAAPRLPPTPQPYLCVCVPPSPFSRRVCTAGVVIVKTVPYMCFRKVHIHSQTFQGPHTFQHPQCDPFTYLRQSPWRSKFAGDEWNDSDAWFGKACIQPWSFQLDGQVTFLMPSHLVLSGWGPFTTHTHSLCQACTLKPEIKLCLRWMKRFRCMLLESTHSVLHLWEPTHFSVHLSALCMYHETLFSRR